MTDRMFSSGMEDHCRRFIEQHARRGESWDRAEARLRREGRYPPAPVEHTTLPRDSQQSPLIPTRCTIGTRDSQTIMDVAVFRLSKRSKRTGDTIRHDLSDGYVEVKAGPDGMASIWDYDLVLMLISHLTEAMNRYQRGKGGKPGRIFRPQISDILKFCCRGDGGRQAIEIEAALDRLKGTTIKLVRQRSATDNRVLREVDAEGLISGYRAVTYTDTGRISTVEIEAPLWLYREVTGGRLPKVLAFHPDYFLIPSGIGRFVYRLARRAAGKRPARYYFQTIYDRSASTGPLKKFTFTLRNLIKANNLPEYELHEESGQEGPVLVMRFRGNRAETTTDQMSDSPQVPNARPESPHL